jgi:O-antigen/teichoic acid export membrane protein
LGNLVPMGVALAAVPFLLHLIGQERLGVLSLIWVVVGYFSFLDMGLGRAVTVAVASSRTEGGEGRVRELRVLATVSSLLVGVGSVIALLLGLGISIWGEPFHLSSPQLSQEVTQALLWMLPSLPLLLLSSTLRGHLEGVGAFRVLNLLRIPTGALLILGPCLTALYTPDLSWACISIGVVRLVQVVALLGLVAHAMDLNVGAFLTALIRSRSAAALRPLLSFGGWVTLSNIVGPVIVYVDRFVISALLSAGAVAVYSVPFDVVSRLPILIASLCSVLLPELARLSQSVANYGSDGHALRRLVRRSSGLSAGMMATVVAVAWVLTPWALRVWMGPEFAEQSTQVTQILLLAFGTNALAQIPFTALQACGLARSVALLHAGELLPYGLVLVWSISYFGIEGAAWAWLLRGVADYGVLAWLWARHADRMGAGIKD